jgi:hypothetical protein
MADGLLTSILGAIDRQKQATKAGLGLLVSDPMEFARNATARYFPTQEEVAQQRALEQSGGMAMNTPYMDKMFNLAQFQGSIKPTGLLQSASPLVREGNPIQSAVVLIGDKIFTGRTHSDALQRAIYEGAIRKEAGRLVFPKGAEINSDLFMTKDGRIIDRLDASKLFDIGASETAIKEGLMQNKPAGSMSVESYMTEAKKLKNKQ